MDTEEWLLRLVNEAFEELARQEYRLSSVLMKAIRIARLRNDCHNLWWLELEMRPWGFWATDPSTLYEIMPHYTADEFGRQFKEFAERYAEERRMTGGVTKMTKPHGASIVAAGVAEIEQKIGMLSDMIAQLTIAPGSAPSSAASDDQDIKARGMLLDMMNVHRSVLTRIGDRVRRFLTATEAQLVAGQLNSDLFTQNLSYVEVALKETCPEALDQLKIASRRLSEGDLESRSHAVLSCRRLLKTLANRLFPSRAEPIDGMDGKKRVLTEEMYIARLWAFVSERVQGHAAGDLLLQRTEDLGHRIDRLYELV